MKQLICEVCGSTDLMKQDGIFVCQTCGCKYSVEEAKKMMVEGTVEVTGSVKVDVSERVNNLYVMARRAKDENNTELAIKYYEMITLENPYDWEALFYFNYFKVKNTNLKDMDNSVTQFSNSLDSVFDLIGKSDKNPEEKWINAMEVMVEIDGMCASFIHWAKSHYKKYSNLADSISELRLRAFAIADLQKKMADLLEKYFPEKSKQKIVSYLKSYIENYMLLDTISKSQIVLTLKHFSNDLIKTENRIKELDPEYESIVESVSKNANADSGEIQDTEVSDEKQYMGMIQVDYQMGHKGLDGWRACPNSAGGVSVVCNLKNVGTKEIKYFSLFFVPYNTVGDAVSSNIGNTCEQGVKGTGPIAPNQVKYGCFMENAWYNHSISSVKLVKAIIEYIDGTVETISGDKITSISNTKSKGERISKASKAAKPFYIIGVLEMVVSVILFFILLISGIFDKVEGLFLVWLFLMVGVPFILVLIGRLIDEVIYSKNKHKK